MASHGCFANLTVKFYSVDADELTTLREDFPAGRWQPHIEEGQISLAAYHDFTTANLAEIEAHQKRQQAAFRLNVNAGPGQTHRTRVKS